MRRLAVLLLLLFSLLSTINAQEDISTFQSEDGAVTFEYPEYWTIEDQIFTFGELYRYYLWTPDANPMVSIPRSRIIFDVVNRNQDDYEGLENPSDLLDALADAEGFTPLILEEKNLTILESPATRIEFITSTNVNPIILYAIVFDPDWMIFASLSPIEEEAELHEQDLLSIIESLQFDTTLASLEFSRDLEEYQFEEEIDLDARYESNDGYLTMNYPADWELIEDSSLTNFTSNFYYYVNFETSNAQIDVTVVDVSDPALNAPADQNTSGEYLALQRTLSDSFDVREFRLNSEDVVSVSGEVETGGYEQVISYAHNPTWVISISATAETEEVLQALESQLVATLASVEFVIGAAYIQFPILNVELPEPWQIGTAQFQNGEAYEFILRPSDDLSSVGRRILIQIVNLQAFDMAEAVEEEGVEVILDSLTSNGAESFTEIEIGDYIAYDSDILSEDEEVVGRYLVILLDDSWVFVSYAGAFSEDDLNSAYADLEIITENMVITLPED